MVISRVLGLPEPGQAFNLILAVDLLAGVASKESGTKRVQPAINGKWAPPQFLRIASKFVFTPFQTRIFWHSFYLPFFSVLDAFSRPIVERAAGTFVRSPGEQAFAR